MKLSVIVPVYNVEKYLAVCVDSLLKQTLSDMEIILVDVTKSRMACAASLTSSGALFLYAGSSSTRYSSRLYSK